MHSWQREQTDGARARFSAKVAALASCHPETGLALKSSSLARNRRDTNKVGLGWMSLVGLRKVPGIFGGKGGVAHDPDAGLPDVSVVEADHVRTSGTS